MGSGRGIREDLGEESGRGQGGGLRVKEGSWGLGIQEGVGGLEGKLGVQGSERGLEVWEGFRRELGVQKGLGFKIGLGSLRGD